MSDWFQIVRKDDKQLENAIEYYLNEHKEAKKEIDIKQYTKTADAIAEFTSHFEHRYDQYAEIMCIYKHYDNKLKNLKGGIRQNILKDNPRAINSSDLNSIIDGNPVVAELSDKLNQIELVKAKYEGLSKAFEALNWQISNLVKLQVAGLDGALVPV